MFVQNWAATTRKTSSEHCHFLRSRPKQGLGSRETLQNVISYTKRGHKLPDTPKLQSQKIRKKLPLT